MQNLLAKINQAKTDSAALDSLLHEYLPFIRQEAGRQAVPGIEYDDRVSIGMLTFANCVRQYQPDRGNFLSYTTVAIRNRLIDEARKQARAAQNTIPLETEDRENAVISFQEQAAIQAHTRQQQRAALAEEIALLSGQLQGFRVRFDDLDRQCPKHSRLRQECIQAAAALAKDPMQARRLMETRRLPIAYLAETSGLPVKTLEKFRRYLVAIAVIFIGDYPNIRSFVTPEEGLEQ